MPWFVVRTRLQRRTGPLGQALGPGLRSTGPVPGPKSPDRLWTPAMFNSLSVNQALEYPTPITPTAHIRICTSVRRILMRRFIWTRIGFLFICIRRSGKCAQINIRVNIRIITDGLTYHGINTESEAAMRWCFWFEIASFLPFCPSC